MKPRLGDKLKCISGKRYNVIGIGKPGTRITVEDLETDRRSDICQESYDDMRQNYLNS